MPTGDRLSGHTAFTPTTSPRLTSLVISARPTVRTATPPQVATGNTHLRLSR
ncbi:hypothetical protein SHJG_p244 (plasmid) [Streptomyces hygroscopicus subsp. jinggangensis 5008]|nr:hypothetical protein SHJG_p244 [Streptomyces hygroscopicus subsp. jinggangensis 5008]AGF68513.1 hypothetical protein SHJGH_p244 [Streptomyces hygroscopicus subsp. jinggangensis TL01]